MTVTLEEMKARLSPEDRAYVEYRSKEIIDEIDGLQALRLACASTQVELANRLNVSQASVAKLERRADMLLSTLREYVEGLGGELDLVVRFGDKKKPLLLTKIGDIFDNVLAKPVHRPIRKVAESPIQRAAARPIQKKAGRPTRKRAEEVHA